MKKETFTDISHQCLKNRCALLEKDIKESNEIWKSEGQYIR
jgi:hypothetical protein